MNDEVLIIIGEVMSECVCVDEASYSPPGQEETVDCSNCVSVHPDQ